MDVQYAEMCVTFLSQFDRRTDPLLVEQPGWDFVWKHYDRAMGVLKPLVSAGFTPPSLGPAFEHDEILPYIQCFQRWGVGEVLKAESAGIMQLAVTHPLRQSLGILGQALTVLERDILVRAQPITATWFQVGCACGETYIVGEALLPETDAELSQRMARMMAESAAMAQICPQCAAVAATGGTLAFQEP